jgi:hypothetical protein
MMRLDEQLYVWYLKDTHDSNNHNTNIILLERVG